MDVTTASFDRDVIERSREIPVVVDFWAPWCGPCRTLGPIIEAEAGKREGRMELVKVDIQDEPEIGARYGIQSIPTVALFKDGVPVTGFLGAHPAKAVSDFLDQALGAEEAAA